jgi:hypothetical protein
MRTHGISPVFVRVQSSRGERANMLAASGALTNRRSGAAVGMIASKSDA